MFDKEYLRKLFENLAKTRQLTEAAKKAELSSLTMKKALLDPDHCRVSTVLRAETAAREVILELKGEFAV